MSATAPARRATIFEVARLAGVSHQTVSRYLKDSNGLKAANRERVESAIRELDYRPSLTARAMRTTRTGRLAILFPSGNAASSLRMLEGATDTARQAGYQVDSITVAGNTAQRSERMLELAEAGLFEGLLALTPLATEREAQIASRVPVVVGAEYDDEMRGIGDLADASPVAEIIESLARQGHRTFLHIAGDRSYTTVRSREEAFFETIERLGLESAGSVGGDWLGETGRRAVLDLPDDTRVTAIIAANDHLAAAAIHGAIERGWRVPHDISVSGWDDDPVGAWLPPTLTTVSIDYEELGRRSMSKLLATIRDEELPSPTEPVASVVWRGSTAPVHT